MDRPPPLRTDGTNEFARFSMAVRVPKILEEVAQRNPDYSPAVRHAVMRLAADIGAGAPLPALSLPAPDEVEWQPECDERRGESWLGTDWFFAECYAYRALLVAARYFETGRDPFAPAKREELDGDRLWHALDSALRISGQPAGEKLTALLGAALWGNRVDLSYAVGAAFGVAGSADDLLCDDRRWAVERLLASSGEIHIVTDNAGSELAMDLALVDAILERGPARVTLHVKAHPIFVSDVTAGDVWGFLAVLRARGGLAQELGERLERAFDDERWRLLPDPFWNGPRFLWQRPARLSRAIDGGDLVVLKGDANYRRAVGDALWPQAITFAEATAYFPAPLVCLRTMKSDALVGLAAARMAELDRADPAWRINGRRGLIQGKR